MDDVLRILYLSISENLLESLFPGPAKKALIRTRFFGKPISFMAK